MSAPRGSLWRAVAGSAFGAIALFVSVVAQNPRLADDGLARLTVPPSHLPTTCRLEIVVAPFAMYPGVRENPWIGSRQPTVALIRRLVEGEPREHENLSSVERLERGAVGTVDGYIASYKADDDGQVSVYAVRFSDPNLTLRAAAVPLGGEAPRIIVGATAIRLYLSRPTTRVKGTAAMDGCYEAVRKYLSALK